MLVLHSSSRCDVCLSEYTWETSGKRPHAIACGHIFCRDCLYTNSPPLCPLCRKPYQPNKMKKLHVDRPEDIDDHRELDLLQRLAVSWDIPAEQLEELTSEVDLWLRDRSDDTCIALRKARAALRSHRDFNTLELSLEDNIRRLEERLHEQNMFVQQEQNRAAIISEASSSKIDSLTKENYALKFKIESLQSLTQRYTQLRNPLPRPPEPISTGQLPTFEQAVSESGSLGVRFTSLPVSPRSPPSPYPFEVEKRHRKGKSKSKEQGYFDDPIYQPPNSTHALPSPSHYVRPHVATPPSQHDHSPKQSTRAQGLQMHFDSTAQPLDAFALTHAYLREYSSGFVNGQEAALGKRISEFSNNQSPYPGQPSSTRHAAQPRTAFEPSQGYRTTNTNANVYQTQPYSAPVTNERPSHRRQLTASSIMSSGSSVQNDRSPSRSRSRPRSRRSESSSVVSRYSNPVLASILSDAPSPPHRQPFDLVSPQPTLLPQQQQQQPSLNRTSSIASNAQIPPATRRNSPSARSHMTLQSSDTWGTATPSHLTTGSLISGLAGFRWGAEPALMGGQEAPSFHELASDGASIRTREMSISENSSETTYSPPSPVRPVHSMVGVLPADGEANYSYRSASAYRSPASFDTRPHQSGRNTNTNEGFSHAHHRGGFVSEYQIDDDRSQQQHYQQQQQRSRVVSPNYSHTSSQDERSSTYRSPPSVDNRGYDPYPRTETHAASRIYSYANNDHDHRQEDLASVTSSERQGRSRRPPAHTRASHLSLPGDSPSFPLNAEYTDEDHQSNRNVNMNASPTASPPVVLESFGNALGLQLHTGPTPISAPTPVVSSRPFLRSWSREHYES